MTKSAIVCGAGGFIGHHLVKRLKDEGYSVRGIDRKRPEFEPSPADEFLTCDLRWVKPTDWMLAGADEIYQLAAEMGGMGFIGDPRNDALIMSSSTQIHLNILDAAKLYRTPPKVFFSSSACVYSEWYKSGHKLEDKALAEPMAYPADIDSEYGWEKLYAERLYAAYARCYEIPVRIARIHNCYGPLGSWRGGREKAPAALCRKVAEAARVQRGLQQFPTYQELPEVPTVPMIEIWGDGRQLRSFMYVDDCIEGIRLIMDQLGTLPPILNLGSDEITSVTGLAELIQREAGTVLPYRFVEGANHPRGVLARNSDNTRIRETLNWEPTTSLQAGIRKLYPWVEEQVQHQRATEIGPVAERPAAW